MHLVEEIVKRCNERGGSACFGASRLTCLRLRRLLSLIPLRDDQKREA